MVDAAFLSFQLPCLKTVFASHAEQLTLAYIHTRPEADCCDRLVSSKRLAEAMSNGRIRPPALRRLQPRASASNCSARRSIARVIFRKMNRCAGTRAYQ